MYGWHLKILRVNLTTHKVTTEDVDPKIARDYLGGRGWAIHYLYKEMDPMADPLSPENKLIFATGPLTATPAPTGNRYMVVTKSPLTGALAHSNSGGEFPTWMKRTGFDLYIFEGRSPEPVYLFVNEDQVEVRSAAHVWGKDTHETTDILKAETSEEARVACIGPAGENLALMAAIMNDKHRAAARSGVGAVMGSKNLKAVVAMGSKNPPLHDPEGMRTLSVETSKNVGADVKKGSNMRIYGTSYVPQVTNTLGILPTHNFLQGTFEHVHNVDGDALKNQYLIRHTPCYRCPLSCGRLTEVPDGPYKGKGEGPEYETISSLGTGCGVSNLAALVKANYLCNEYGMDTISTGMTIAAAMEMYEKGYIPEEVIGQPLKFGDHDAMIAMIKLMAYNEGFGKELAQGSYRLAEKYGHPEIAVTTRKQEFPGYDPRGSQGMGLLYATSNKGASHMEGDVAYEEVFGVPVKENPLTTEGKPELVKHFEDSFALMDSSGVCVFVGIRYMFNKDRMILPQTLANMMNLSTGAGYTAEEALRAADRVYTLERMFLLKAGSTEDTLPHRMLHEPLPDGPAKGKVVELDKMLPEFYKLRGWDEKGWPTKEKLADLGLPLN
ncbi:MAG TPA: aldehyde ferredoxin oxidoreductase family protein [Anaerolineales bacterium]|nr:aldehyde ferredoxin oxidoreductase family protein [Anaerolineales bacterium]HMV97848.1 aldehyde ferredoxin oxidoreductase family protein [Anaerolineales bacterium]HMX18919.1 aldehyde ferredoxin oxidoreductase family protein [Anaerolineales bacterium]HMX75295.1 aldehyde ferredoxin oxidoreductase family protein [Anaerolineales bacterium]HMZ42657.1 aldehyde ferredoxin oxidoreductase family protein [Anaerolineales bacterium]